MRKMKRSVLSLHHIRRLGLLLLMLVGVAGVVHAQRMETLTSNYAANNVPLENGIIYTITQNVTISAVDCHSAMKVADGATATIYIPRGLTLTVNGSNGNGRISGGAGITVPSNSTLVITGEGTLNVRGGNAGAGGAGSNGGDGWLNQKTEHGAGGQGGQGGYGGGGAGAAIGGYGGNGHAAQNGPGGTEKYCGINKYDHTGNNGYASVKGDNGYSMGKVYVMGSVTINATGGQPSYTTAGAGNWGRSVNDKGSGWTYYYTSGAGGPGGGGGSGYGVTYDVGGGAPGAQCGGTGASGGTWSQSGSWAYNVGRSGAGGKGHYNGAQNSNTPGSRGGAAGGAQSGDEASSGGHGNLYSLGTRNVGNRTAEAHDEAWMGRALPKYLYITLQFDNGNETSDRIENMNVLYGVDMKQIKAPRRTGYHFLGYYDQKAGGRQIYDSNGNPTSVSLFTENTTIYAQWTSSCAQNTTTKKMYTETVEEAINEANIGDCIYLYADQTEVHLDKAITLDLGGKTIDSLYVGQIANGTAYVTNGTVRTMLGSPEHDVLYKGRIELDEITVDNLYADGHTVIINSGHYGKVCNQALNSANDLSSITIKGEDTYVESINSNEELASGSVLIVGGWYTCDPTSAQNNVTIPGYAILAKTNAPIGEYIYNVALRNDFTNAVHLQGNYIDTKVKATEGVTIDCAFMLHNMPKNTYVPIFGSTDAAPDNAHKGFGLYVNTYDRSFVFAAGTEFVSSPGNIVEVGQNYYVSLKNGEIRIDTVQNAARDYYHQNVAMYQYRENGQNITIGRVNGSKHDQCDMTLYHFYIDKDESSVLRLEPAFGMQNTATDICLYDELTGATYYDVEGHQLEGEVGICNHHPAYRIGAGIVGKRICVICGQQEEPEHFLEYNGVIASNFNFNDLTSASRYRVHYADSEAPYLERTVTTNSLMDLRNIKIFSVEVFEGTQVKHQLVPTTSCDKYFLCDEITGKYYAVNENTNANFDKVDTHIMEETDLGDDMVMKVCHGCGINNGVSMNSLMTFDTGMKIDDDTKIIMRFKAEKGVKVDENLMGAKDGNGRGDHQMILHANTVNNSNNTMTLGMWVGADTKHTTSFSINIEEPYVVVVQHGGSTHNYSMRGDTIFLTESNSIQAFNETLRFGCHNAETDANSSNFWGHFTIYDCKIYKNDKQVAHFVPSIYENDLSFYDICSGNIHKANWKTTTPSSDRTFIEPCEEHVHLTSTPSEENGEYYRTCYICNETMKDGRSFICTNSSSWVDTQYKPTGYTMVHLNFSIQSDSKVGANIMGSWSPNDIYWVRHEGNRILTDFMTSKPSDSGLDFQYNEYISAKLSAMSTEFFKKPNATTPYCSWYTSDSKVPTYSEMIPPIYIGACADSDGKNISAWGNNSNINIYNFDIYEGDSLVRSFIPTSQGGKLGFYESFENKFYPMQGEGATGIIQPCSNHIFCDYVMDDETGKLVSHCRICNAKSELEDDAFVTNNGGAYFDLGLTATEHTHIEATTRLNKAETSKRIEWPITAEPGQPITVGTGFDQDGLPLNINIYNVYVFEGEDELTHLFLPSLWNGKSALYDVKTDTHVYASSPTAASSYVPECDYHRYFQLETSSDKNGLHIFRHCKLCDAVTQLNGIVVENEDSLRKYVYADNGLMLHLDLVSETYEQSYVGTQYPKLTNQDIVCGVAVMKEGQLQEYYLPAVRKDSKGGITSGMYNAVKNRFVAIPGSTVAINGCAHTYAANDFVSGNILSHCYLCDETFGDAKGYYIDLTYDANGGKGEMGKQRITTLDDEANRALRNNGFTYGAHYFGGWEMRKGKNVTLLQPGQLIDIKANKSDNMVLYAHWNDGFICNGDTLEVNSTNTADIRIVDDGEHGFEATGAFKAAQISYERPLDGSKQTWGTLCLPFELSSDDEIQLYNVAGIVQIKNLGKNVTGLRLSPTDKVDAGMPCIFEITKPGASTLTLNASNVSVKPNVQINNSTDAALEQIMLKGSYEYLTFPCDRDNTYFAIQGDAFYSVGKGRALTVRPYHAYLEVPQQAANAREQILLVKSYEEATSIQTIDTEKEEGKWYTIDGKAVSKPQRGSVYILKYKNGKSEKILIR